MPRKKKKIKHAPYNEFKVFLLRESIKLKEIATLLGCTVPTVSMKNNGNAEYTMSEVNKICEKYNISSEVFRSKVS